MVTSFAIGNASVDCRKIGTILPFLCVMLLCLSPLSQAQAPITSSGLNTHVSQAPGNAAQYDITGGTRPGNGPNLFHSFGAFGVPAGQTANFLNDSGLATSNILGRVTGGSPSNIFGMIQTTGFGAANLFLMNPAGIVFGPNASLNVGGSVSFTTADYLRLADGAKFTALPSSSDAAISSAPVAAFGFLGSNPAAITLQGGRLAVAEGQSLSLVGGNIEITAGALPDGSAQAARLSAPGGQIALVSAASPGEVSLSMTSKPAADASLGAFASRGTISLSRGTVIETSGESAGRILIRAGQFVMDDAVLAAHSTSTAPNQSIVQSHSGDISIQADDVNLSQGTTIATSTVHGMAGDISLEAAVLRSNVASDGAPIPGAAPVTISSTSTGQGGSGSISLTGPQGGVADALLLSNTQVVTSVTNAAQPTVAPGHIDMTAEHLELKNGTVLKTDSTGGADAGSITMKVGTLLTEAGPDGRVTISSSSNCDGCLGGQAGDITIEGIPGVTPTETRLYVFVGTPEKGATDPITYHMARNIDLKGTDIRSEAAGNAPGGMVIMRAQDSISITDTTISVATQDFQINGSKPSGELVRNQGFSRIDVLARDITLKDSTVRADANVSDIGSCPLCLGGPSAGEIWFRSGNSFTADNSSIINSSRGRAAAGLTKIIGDHFFSFGAIWEPDYPDYPTKTVTLNHSEVTVESVDLGLPGYLRIRGDHVTLNHSILNSKVNDVTSNPGLGGDLIDVPGAGERGRVIADGRDVQGSTVVSAKTLDIIGGGIIAPTTGNRIGSRIELLADVVTTRPGTGPGGTLNAPRILNPADPTRVVLETSSTGTGGAGRIAIAGEGVAMPEGTPYPPTSSIHLTATDLVTDTNSDALGGKIELISRGPIVLQNTTMSANVTDVRPQSVNLQEQGSNIAITAKSLSLDGGGISALSRGTQTGGNILIETTEGLSLLGGAKVSANSLGSGNAGNITFNAGSQFIAHDASVTTEATQASGGNITVRATDAIRLVNSELSTSVHGGPQTSGGNISIDPAVMTLQNSQILAQAVQGQGGNISIAAGTFLADQTSVVSASSEFGLSGTVTIQSPVSSLSGTLATLPQRPLQAHSLLQQRCAAQSQGQLSSFTVTSRDTLPSEPGGWLMSSMAMLPEPTPVAAAEPVHGLPLSIVPGQFVPGPFAHRRGSSWRGGLMDWIEGCGG
jgi:filamentous hemagglutinin family protein